MMRCLSGDGVSGDRHTCRGRAVPPTRALAASAPARASPRSDFDPIRWWSPTRQPAPGLQRKVGAGGAPGCYAPDQNVDAVYEPGSQGCECDPEVDVDVCVADSTGREVGLVCGDGQWQPPVEDGPCEPLPRANCSEGSCPGDAVCAEVVPGGFRACVGELVSATTCYDHPESECCEDADCATGACVQSLFYPSGPCGLGGADPTNQCLSDECDSDTDCGSDSVCAWRGVAGARRVCIAADCKVDADCDLGGVCVLVQGGCLQGTGVGMDTFRSQRLACAYRDDYCSQDIECSASGMEACVVEGGEAHCQAL